MPITANDFLWETTGFHASGTSVVITHPDAGGTTAGTSVVIGMYNGVVNGIPAGFASVGAASAQWAYVKSNVAAGETSWTFTLAVSTAVGWYMAEIDNLALDDPYDGNAATGGATIADGATKSTNTVALNGGSSGIALAFFGVNKAGGSDTQSWANYTNGFTERVDAAPGEGVTGRQIAVAYKLYDGWGSHETTATLSTSAGSASTAAQIVLLRSNDASINAPLAFHTGFEFGTHAGMGNGSTGPLGGGPAPTGTWGTNYLVQAGSARNGSYGLKLVSSASTTNVLLPSLASNTISISGNIKVESGSGTPVVAVIDGQGGSADNVFVRYDVTNEKFGVDIGNTTVWQTGTTPLNTWAWIDICAKMNSSVFHVDWSIETGTGDGTQTSPDDLTGRTPVTSFQPYLGQLSAFTVTAHYDDWVYSRWAGAHPLGSHAVRLLVPETSGATVSGTSTNFQRFTSNGTLANVDGTEGALLDEVPPTISSSSDGVVQVATAASDYLNLPMTTYTLASDEIIAGVRFVASLWGGTGAGTGTLGWRGHDGTSETTLVAAGTAYDADSLTTASSTYPRWDSAMWSGGVNGAWNQTRLNAAAVRMGFSTDAAPDMGASAVYLEVAIKKVRLEVLFGQPGGLYVEAHRNQDSLGLEGFTMNIPSGQSATVDWEVDGTPSSTGLKTSADSPFYQNIPDGGESLAKVNKITLKPG